MDPITATVIAGLLWFFLGGIGGAVVYLIFIGLGVLLADRTSREGWAALGVFVGWLGAVLWSGFVLFQVVMHAVHLVQLIVGG